MNFFFFLHEYIYIFFLEIIGMGIISLINMVQGQKCPRTLRFENFQEKRSEQPGFRVFTQFLLLIFLHLSHDIISVSPSYPFETFINCLNMGSCHSFILSISQ